MSNFEREDRYTVIKHNQLTDEQIRHLKDLIIGEGVPTVDGVVIESDWSEYEHVWKIIENRVANKELKIKLVGSVYLGYD